MTLHEARTDRCSLRPRRSVLVGVVAFGIGLALVVLAIPRAAAYLKIAPWAVKASALPGSEDLQGLSKAQADHCSAAIKLPGDAELQQQCAGLTMRLAALVPDREDSEVLLAEAATRLRRGVADAPNTALGWSLLAVVEDARSAPANEIVEYLRMSYLTGPYEAASMLLRVRIALARWDAMPVDIQANLERDLRSIWAVHSLQRELVGVYLSADFKQRSIIRRSVLLMERDVRLFDGAVRRAAALSGVKKN